jgi:anti-anti-sigma factor
MQLKTASAIVPSARQEGDALVAAVNGEVDLNNSPELRTVLLHLVSEHAPRRLVLNLAQVPYMDSSAIAVLVELLRKVGKGGKIILTNLQPRVRGLLEIARLDTIFLIVNSEQEALGQ